MLPKTVFIVVYWSTNFLHPAGYSAKD